jgi:hypothetical protein
MNERTASKGPNLGLLLLIPAAVIIAKGMRHRRAMWESGWTPSGAGGRGYGHHGPFGSEGEAAARSFRLPPKIEWMLDTWHSRAHQNGESIDSTTPEPETI